MVFLSPMLNSISIPHPHPPHSHSLPPPTSLSPPRQYYVLPPNAHSSIPHPHSLSQGGTVPPPYMKKDNLHHLVDSLGDGPVFLNTSQQQYSSPGSQREPPMYFATQNALGIKGIGTDVGEMSLGEVGGGGTKRKFQVEGEQDGGEEEMNGMGRRKRGKSIGQQNINSEKRKEQNRAAQRAFRERKEKYVRELEDKLGFANSENREMKEYINDLENEVAALRNKMTLLQQQLPSFQGTNQQRQSPPFHPPSQPTTQSPQFQPQPQPTSQSPPQPQQHIPAATQHHPDLNSSTNLDTSVPMTATTDELSGSGSGSEGMEGMEAMEGMEGMDLSLPSIPLDFDLDTISPSFLSLPLPPLFFSTVLPPTTSTSRPPTPSLLDTDRDGQGERGEVDEDEDLDSLPPALVCDKPECNFDALSCALPSPWRPPPTREGREEKDVVSCERAWAKLASHPEFKQCNVDELCLELRGKAKCTPSGRLGVEKEDLWAVYRSIPERARAREMLRKDQS
ncbi:hypothetical protein BT69DRAFT_1255585 [Atractiella rhizophila]|nr:hypothetical protein BT69DRAFT_1255585 [Atractiella rhizophila]